MHVTFTSRLSVEVDKQMSLLYLTYTSKMYILNKLIQQTNFINNMYTYFNLDKC